MSSVFSLMIGAELRAVSTTFNSRSVLKNCVSTFLLTRSLEEAVSGVLIAFNLNTCLSLT